MPKRNGTIEVAKVFMGWDGEITHLDPGEVPTDDGQVVELEPGDEPIPLNEQADQWYQLYWERDGEQQCFSEVYTEADARLIAKAVAAALGGVPITYTWEA